MSDKKILTDNYINVSTAKVLWQVSSKELRQLTTAGEIRTVQILGRPSLYCEEDIKKIHERKISSSRRKVCYVRVPFEYQSAKLEQQVEIFKISNPHHEIITDIGSGLDFRREGFTFLLDKLYKKEIEEIVLTRKEQLCSFAFELIEFICKRVSCRIVIVEPQGTFSPEDNLDFSNDLATFTTSFVCRNNALKGVNKGKKRKIDWEKKEEGSEVSLEEQDSDDYFSFGTVDKRPYRQQMERETSSLAKEQP